MRKRLSICIISWRWRTRLRSQNWYESAGSSAEGCIEFWCYREDNSHRILLAATREIRTNTTRSMMILLNPGNMLLSIPTDTCFPIQAIIWSLLLLFFRLLIHNYSIFDYSHWICRPKIRKVTVSLQQGDLGDWEKIEWRNEINIENIVSKNWRLISIICRNSQIDILNLEQNSMKFDKIR
jgi:hypothetical protein